MMLTRSSLAVLLLLLMTSPGVAQIYPGPVQLTLTSACDGNQFFLRVVVDNYDIFPMTMDVHRTESVPDMAGELVLAAGLVIPPDQLGTEFVLADPGIGPEDIGYYEATVSWLDGTLYNVFSAQLSCTEEPFVMRGFLVTNDIFQPCTDLGLLECDTVILKYGDMNQHVGTGELLDIYGWPQVLNGRDDCSVFVVRIVSLGVGVACDEAVSDLTASWSSVKATYR